MATTGTAQMSKKDQIRAARRAVAPLVKDMLTAECVLLDAQIAASPSIAKLIAKSGSPSHRILLDRDTETARRVRFTARKIGEYLGDVNGVAVVAKPDEDGNLPAGVKSWPVYGIKLETEDEDSDD